MSQDPQKHHKVHKNDSLVEQLRDLGSGVGKTIAHDVVGGITSDAMNSLFGTPKSGDLKPGQSVNLHQNPPPPQYDTLDMAPPPLPRMPERFPFPFKKKEQFKPLYTQEQLNLLRQQEQEVQQKIEEIRSELKLLIAEIKDSVGNDIQQAVDTQVVDPDLYHMSFFDRIKNMLQNALKQIKESRSWMNTQKSKKKQMGYWNQYKKKGTSFGLSHERNVATQVG